MLIMVVIIDSFNHNKTDSPKKADVIIMLGGDSGRLEKSVELYHNGYADYVMISPEIESIRSQSTEYAIELGIPQSAIIEEHKATSTYTNATETLKLMGKYDFNSALVVTSDYHLKRSKMIYDRVNNGQYELTYIAAVGPNAEQCNVRTVDKRHLFSELYKLWGYRQGLYNFIELLDAYEGN